MVLHLHLHHNDRKLQKHQQKYVHTYRKNTQTLHKQHKTLKKKTNTILRLPAASSPQIAEYLVCLFFCLFCWYFWKASAQDSLIIVFFFLSLYFLFCARLGTLSLENNLIPVDFFWKSFWFLLIPFTWFFT